MSKSPSRSRSSSPTRKENKLAEKEAFGRVVVEGKYRERKPNEVRDALVELLKNYDKFRKIYLMLKTSPGSHFSLTDKDNILHHLTASDFKQMAREISRELVNTGTLYFFYKGKKIGERRREIGPFQGINVPVMIHSDDAITKFLGFISENSGYYGDDLVDLARSALNVGKNFFLQSQTIENIIRLAARKAGSERGTKYDISSGNQFGEDFNAAFDGTQAFFNKKEKEYIYLEEEGGPTPLSIVRTLHPYQLVDKGYKKRKDKSGNLVKAKSRPKGWEPGKDFPTGLVKTLIGLSTFTKSNVKYSTTDFVRAFESFESHIRDNDYDPRMQSLSLNNATKNQLTKTKIPSKIKETDNNFRKSVRRSRISGRSRSGTK